MVFRITLNVRHIKGHTFDIEVDHDADCLGVKVAIWEAQNIPVESQRLVYAGKELAEDQALAGLGIDDGSTLFLVESGAQDEAVSVDAFPMPEVSQPVVEPEVVVAVNSMNVQQAYQPLEEDNQVTERIAAVVGISYFLRIWCVIGFFVSLVSAVVGCLGSLIPMIFFALGYYGARKLNRCCLFFPMVIAVVAGVIGTVGGIIGMVYVHPLMFLAVVFGILHLMIFASILKLFIHLNRLTCQQRKVAVQRIYQKRICGCC